MSLGQAKVVDMRQSDCEVLKRLIKSHRELDDPTLQSLALAHKVPNSVDGKLHLFLWSQGCLLLVRLKALYPHKVCYSYQAH